ncbi:MAG: TolC family protein, partial [Rikenellaceae bacterium]
EKYNSTKLYLTSSTEAVRQIEKKYSVGAATIVDYNTAMNNYIDASSKHSQAKYEYIFKTRIIQFYMRYLK